MTLVQQIIAVALAYRRAENVAISTVSSRVFNDGKKLGALIDGANILTRRHLRAMRWFSENWPENAIWPEGVTRPDVVAEASTGGGGQ